MPLLEQCRLVAPVSSRLRKTAASESHVFSYLRTLVSRFDAERDRLLIANGTAIYRYVKHLAEILQIPILEISRAGKKLVIDDIVASIESRSEANDARAYVWVEPTESLDWMQFEIADEIRVLKFRCQGKIQQLVQRTVAREFVKPPKRIFVASSGTTPSEVESFHELLKQGAIGWHLTENEASSKSEPSPKLATRATAKRGQLYKIDDFDSAEFLNHFTRPVGHDSPVLSESQRLNDILFSDFSETHAALTALTRIVVTQTLLSSNKLTPTDCKMCCFTDVPLRSFDEHRVFRSHISRWDFLPYGVSIRKSVLVAGGAQPVIYGSPELFESLDSERQPFFQMAETTTKSGNVIDWTNEREWRIRGNLDLSSIAHESIFVFVPDIDAANYISEFTNWRVCILQ